MRLVFMGTPEFGVPALKGLVAGEHDVVAVYTQPDRPSGRGRTPSAPPVKRVAEGYGLPVFQPDRLKDATEVGRLAGFNPDAIVVVAYGTILPAQVLRVPAFGCLNIHPSLLPRYRGPSPIASAIISGDVMTGVTVMLLDEGTDTGPILTQRSVPIAPSDTTASLEGKLAEAGADLLVEALPLWFDHCLEPRKQPEDEASYTRQISKGDGDIDWALSAEDIERRVRAFHPWPSCYTRWRGKMLKIIEAEALTAGAEGEPGTVVALASRSEMPVGVVTGQGILGLRRLQIEGKKAVPATEFARGRRDFAGGRLG